MHGITDWLGGLSGPVIYAVAAALVFCEDPIFVGFVLPGETAVVLGGVLDSQGKERGNPAMPDTPPAEPAVHSP